LLDGLLYLHGQSEVQVAGRLELLTAAGGQVFSQTVEEVHDECYLFAGILHDIQAAG
jgi:hypothetical protein